MPQEDESFAKGATVTKPDGTVISSRGVTLPDGTEITKDQYAKRQKTVRSPEEQEADDLLDQHMIEDITRSGHASGQQKE